MIDANDLASGLARAPFLNDLYRQRVGLIEDNDRLDFVTMRLGV